MPRAFAHKPNKLKQPPKTVRLPLGCKCGARIEIDADEEEYWNYQGPDTFAVVKAREIGWDITIDETYWVCPNCIDIKLVQQGSIWYL